MHRRFRYHDFANGRRVFESLDERRMLDGSAIITEFLAVNDDGIRDGRGIATDWIEVFNPGNAPVDLAGWRLTDDADDNEKWTFPPTRLEPGEFLTVYASACVVVGIECPSVDTELHTNFSLSAEGEYLGLLRPGRDNILASHGLNTSSMDLDFLVAPWLTITESIGGKLRYFSDPTPSLTNGSGFVNVVNDTQFSVDRGFYDVPFELTISSNTPGSTIIFTTDGSLPSLSNRTLVVADETTSIPVAKMSIGSTTYVRAIAVKDRYLSTNVDTQTYLFLEDVIRQDTLSVSDGSEYPTIWQAGATADFEMDPEVVA